MTNVSCLNGWQTHMSYGRRTTIYCTGERGDWGLGWASPSVTVSGVLPLCGQIPAVQYVQYQLIMYRYALRYSR